MKAAPVAAAMAMAAAASLRRTFTPTASLGGGPHDLGDDPGHGGDGLGRHLFAVEGHVAEVLDDQGGEAGVDQLPGLIEDVVEDGGHVEPVGGAPAGPAGGVRR